MEALAVAASVTSALVALLGLVWAVLFGQHRNLVDIMTSRRGKQPKAQLPTDTRASVVSTSSAPRRTRTKSGRAIVTLPQDPTDSSVKNNTLYIRWLATTSRLILLCWVAGSEFDFDPNSEFTLGTATGCALRAFLVLPVVLLLLGLFFTVVGLAFGTSSGSFQFGGILLGGFLATFVTEFFILGVLCIIGLVLAIMPEQVEPFE